MFKIIVHYDGKVYESVPTKATKEDIEKELYHALPELNSLKITTENGMLVFGKCVIQKAIFEVVEA